MPTNLTLLRPALTTVGIGEMAVAHQRDAVLVTYSLGSCIGVSMFDPEAGIGGLIHCMLPVSSAEPDKAALKPAMYVDTGLVAMMQAMINLGADTRRLVIKVAGAASPLDQCSRFKIGERNVTVMRKVLWKNNLMLTGEQLGGVEPRTMFLVMQTGQTILRSGGAEYEL